MSRFKITVRGTDPRVELRGYIDVERMESLTVFSEAMRGFGIVVASIAEDDYDPFRVTDWPEFTKALLRELPRPTPESERENADRWAGDE
jgi:hypothetical protein